MTKYTALSAKGTLYVQQQDIMMDMMSIAINSKGKIQKDLLRLVSDWREAEAISKADYASRQEQEGEEI